MVVTEPSLFECCINYRPDRVAVVFAAEFAVHNRKARGVQMSTPANDGTFSEGSELWTADCQLLHMDCQSSTVDWLLRSLTFVANRAKAT